MNASSSTGPAEDATALVIAKPGPMSANDGLAALDGASFDGVVIGVGILGAGTVREFAGRGRRTPVVDRRHVGWAPPTARRDWSTAGFLFLAARHQGPTWVEVGVRSPMSREGSAGAVSRKHLLVDHATEGAAGLTTVARGQAHRMAVDCCGRGRRRDRAEGPVRARAALAAMRALRKRPPPPSRNRQVASGIPPSAPPRCRPVLGPSTPGPSMPAAGGCAVLPISRIHHPAARRNVERGRLAPHVWRETVADAFGGRSRTDVRARGAAEARGGRAPGARAEPRLARH